MNKEYLKFKRFKNRTFYKNENLFGTMFKTEKTYKCLTIIITIITISIAIRNI